MYLIIVCRGRLLLCLKELGSVHNNLTFKLGLSEWPQLRLLGFAFGCIGVRTVMKSHEKSWNLKMHFPGLEKSWILGKIAEVMEKSRNFISLVQKFCAV